MVFKQGEDMVPCPLKPAWIACWVGLALKQNSTLQDGMRQCSYHKSRAIAFAFLQQGVMLGYTKLAVVVPLLHGHC